MESPVIVEGLSKTFKVPVRETGLRESIRSLFRREFRQVEAVKEIDFRLEVGSTPGGC